MAKLISVKYISIWDGDEIVTNAQLNPETGEVVDIETIDISNEYNSCEGEYVEYPSGERVKVLASNGKYFIQSALCQKLIDLINAVLGDLKEFGNEGYPIYQRQIKTINTGNSDSLNSLLKVANQMVDDLDEFKSDNIPVYRKLFKELELVLDC